jgi:probable F420-dependent oxidoreductase
VDFGVGYFPTHDGLRPGAVARLVEERGQQALFFAEHTHIPASRETPYPGGSDLPPKYWHCYELFIALADAAAATTRLRIGSGICLVIERDPIITAKQVASIDHLSGGRFDFGIGAGWNREEMRNHGTDPRVRMTVLAERIEAMKAIWTQEEASYAGRYVAFDRIWCDPKPAQRPYPPILVGGMGERVIDRVLALGDAWFPTFLPSPRLIERIEELRARADRHIDVDVIGAPPDAVALEELLKASVRRACHWLPSGGRSVVEAALERWEAAIAELNGE